MRGDDWLISIGLEKLKCNYPSLDFLKCLNTLVTLGQFFLRRLWRHFSFENFFYSKRWKSSREVWKLGKRVNVGLWISSCFWLEIGSGGFWTDLMNSQILFLLLAHRWVCVGGCVCVVYLFYQSFMFIGSYSMLTKSMKEGCTPLVNKS